MIIQDRLVSLITCLNWVILFLGSLVSFFLAELAFAKGVAFGGLIVTVNFHLLAITLKRSFVPNRIGSYNIILVKYYVRFIVSGLVILILIQQKIVNPLGLFVGLSVVVLSIFIATVVEIKKLIIKEAI